MKDDVQKNLDQLKAAIDLQQTLGIASLKRTKVRDTKAKFDKDKVRAKNKAAKKARKKQRK